MSIIKTAFILLSILASQATFANNIIRTPAPITFKTPIPDENNEIELNLLSGALPDSIIYSNYFFDFSSLVSLSDNSAAKPFIVWSINGAVPAGLILNENGVLNGSSTELVRRSFEIVARHEGKEARNIYSINSRLPDGERTCLSIKSDNPESTSGVYLVSISGKEFQAYCDMISSGGGWMMVSAQFESDPVINWNEGIQSDYDPSLATKRGFALQSSEIPTHTQTAFGKDTLSTAVDFVNFKYSTTEIPKTLVSGTKGQYHIYRNSTYHYGYHDPESYLATDGGAGSQWSRSLTFDLIGGINYTWAFTPTNSLPYKRGYSLNGGMHTTNDNFAWTVWVR